MLIFRAWVTCDSTSLNRARQGWSPYRAPTLLFVNCWDKILPVLFYSWIYCGGKWNRSCFTMRKLCWSQRLNRSHFTVGHAQVVIIVSRISYIPWCIASYYIIKLPNARSPISSPGTWQLKNGGKRLVLQIKLSVPLLCRSIYDFSFTVPNISLVKSKRVFWPPIVS